MWQSETATDYRDFAKRIVQLATSKHVSAVAISAAGTGYTVGDLLTIPHAGGAMLATVEVTTIGGGGTVTGVKLRNMGAYSNRVATVAVNAGGTAYPVSSTVYLRLDGGTWTERAKVSATVNGSGVVTAVSLFEGGGAYTVAPAASAETTTIVGPSTATTGSGATINTTMTGLIGTSAIATTGGTGTGCTLNLTLTATGWTAVRNKNNFSTNGLNDEKEVILLGTVVGGDAPYVGFRTYSIVSGSNTYYGLIKNGFDDFNDLLTYDAQSNPTPDVVTIANGACCTSLLGALSNAPVTFLSWFSIDGRFINAVARCQEGAPVTATAYMHFGCGLMNPFGTATEMPYPMYVTGSTYAPQRNPFAGALFQTGPTLAVTDSTTVTSPMSFRHPGDGTTVYVSNFKDGGGGSGIRVSLNVVYPCGEPAQPGSSVDDIVDFNPTGNNITVFTRGIVLPSPTVQALNLFPTIGDNQTILIPATIISSTTSGANTADCTLRGEIPNVFWVSATKSDGTKFDAEDTITIGTDRYRIFQCAHLTDRYAYFCMKEA